MKRLFIMVTLLVLAVAAFADDVNDSYDATLMLDISLLEVAKSENVEVNDILVVADIVRNYQESTPKYVASKPTETPGALNIRMWYAEYINYMIRVFGKDSEKRILTYSAYTEAVRYWINYVPAHFMFPMLNESLKQDVQMKYIYAISRMETANYQFFKSLKSNTNGTLDFGLMGLNSYNFDLSKKHGVKFLDAYFYRDKEYSKFDHHNQRHILKVGVAYLKDLMSYTGSFKDAAIAYNGGLTRWMKGKPATAAINYSNTVCKYAANTPGPKFDDSRYISMKSLQDILKLKDPTLGDLIPKLRSIGDYSGFSRWYHLYDSNHGADRPLLWFRKPDMDIETEEYCEDIDDIGDFIGTFDEYGRYVVLG